MAALKLPMTYYGLLKLLRARFPDLLERGSLSDIDLKLVRAAIGNTPDGEERLRSSDDK